MIRVKQFITLTSILSVLVSLLVIAGWGFNVAVLKSILPHYDSMKINSAICIGLCGIAMYVFNRGNKRLFPIYKIAVYLVLIIAAMTLLQYITNTNWGIDELAIKDTQPEGQALSYPGRMAYTTAFCYILLGLGLLSANSRRAWARGFIQTGLHLVSFISFIATVGYVFNVPSFYTLAFLTTMAPHTALLTLLLSIATSALIPDKGYAKLFMGTRIGNIMARKLFPVIVVAVFALCLLRLETHWRHMVSVEMGIALLGISFILVTLFLIDNTAGELNHIDSRRAIAEKQLKALNLALEEKVAIRTLELSDSNERLKNFAHIVSHNLRSHSGNISTLLTLIVEEKEDMADDELINMLIHASDNLTETINHLTEVVAMNTQVSDNLKRLHLKKYVQQAIRSIEALANEKHVKIEDHVDEQLYIDGIEAYLDSIILNFLTNGIKYSAQGKECYIRITSTVVPGFVVLSFEDNGIGMDMERVGHKLFGMYKTFHGNSDARGIGLFMTKNQVEAMGGKIETESEVDKGTTFKIYLKHEKI